MITTTILVKGGTLLLVVGFLIHVICFSVPHWYSDKTVSVYAYGGLWLLCVEDVGCDATPDSVGDLFHFVQAMEAISLICSIVAIGTLYWVITNPTTPIVRLCYVFTSAAGVCSLVGSLTFITKFIDHKEWAAYIEPLAGICMAISSILFWLEGRSLIDR